MFYSQLSQKRNDRYSVRLGGQLGGRGGGAYTLRPFVSTSVSCRLHKHQKFILSVISHRYVRFGMLRNLLLLELEDFADFRFCKHYDNCLIGLSLEFELERIK